MNRLISFNQPASIISSRYETNQLEFEYKDTRELRIKPMWLNSGQELLLIPFTNPSGLIFTVNYQNEWTIDLDIAGINESGKIGGILDGIALAADTRYHLWAFADNNLQPKGFGVTAETDSAATIPNANKGTEATITGLTKAYRFTLGARVRCYRSASVWNLGAITSVDSATQIKVLLDNNNVFGLTYGANLTAGAGTVTQLDKYKPYLADDSTQSTIYPYYNLIGWIETDSSSNIAGFSPTKMDTTNWKTVDWFDKDLSPFYDVDLNLWLECNGQTCMIDKSPLIGTAIWDINGEGRFIRGSATSGTKQAATEHPYIYTNSAANVFAPILGSGELRPTNYDTVSGSTTRGYSTFTTSGTMSETYTSRSINISMVAIMKVR